MSNRLLSSVFAASFALVTTGANAVVIDTFDDGAILLTSDDNSPQTGIDTGIAAIGGSRGAVLDNVTGSNAVNTAVLGVVSGALSWNNSTGVISRAAIIWDASTGAPGSFDDVDTTGLGGVDLTVDNDNGFLFSLDAIDLNVTISLTVWDMGTDVFTVENTFSSVVDEYFVSFTPYINAGVDVGDVGAIRMALTTSVAATDASVDLLETNPGTVTVPVPGTLALLGLGLLGMSLRIGTKRA